MSKKNEPVVLSELETGKKASEIRIFRFPVIALSIFAIPALAICSMLVLFDDPTESCDKEEVNVQVETTRPEPEAEVKRVVKEVEPVIEEKIQDSESKTITSKKGNTVNINTDINVSGSNNTVTVNSNVNVE